MSEKKQSSVEWLISCITEDQMIKAKSLNEWLEIFERAKAMHKEEIIEAWYESRILFDYISSNQYYNKTFKK